MRAPRFMAFAFLTALPLIGHAAGLGFLSNSPVYYFTDADRKLMNEAVAAVLGSDDGKALREWNNPRTGASGKVEGLGRFRSAEGLDCRKLRLWTQAKGIEGQATYPVCRAGDGEWRLASGKALTAAQ